MMMTAAVAAAEIPLMEVIDVLVPDMTWFSWVLPTREGTISRGSTAVLFRVWPVALATQASYQNRAAVLRSPKQ